MFGQGHAPVDSWIWKQCAETGTASCILQFRKQANLQDAKRYLDKTEKGTYVFEQLQANAKASQGGVINILQSWHVPFQSFYIVNAIQAVLNQDQIIQFSLHPYIALIEGNVPLHVPNVEVEPLEFRTVTWGINKIGADTVWSGGADGTGIVVGGQDTGYKWTRSNIKDKYRGWDGSNANHSYNWHDAIHMKDPHWGPDNPYGYNSKVPIDDHTHGTHTMGTMVGNNDIGVAPGAQWIGCRNMDRGWGMPSTYIECFEWFLAPTDTANANPDPSKAPHVINNSWGCPPDEGCNSSNFSTMKMAVDNLVDAGILVVVSAGNDGSACSTVQNPAAIYASSFSVGASNSSDQIAGFSSRGPVTVDGSNRKKPDVSAPGVGVSSCDTTASGYQSWSGTSMAGPHVAGAAALLMDAHPVFIGQVGVMSDLFRAYAKHLLQTQNCGTDNNNSVPNNVFGWGRINIKRVIDSAIAFGGLPVALNTFDAQAQGRHTKLNWQTLSEFQLRTFEIEHSLNGKEWNQIASVSAAGNSTETLDYQFVHTNPLPGTNYYRLKIIDQGGEYVYSKTRTVLFPLGTGETIILYPSPARQFIQLRFSNDVEAYQVVDITGRKIPIVPTPQADSGGVISISVSQWVPGTYFLQCFDTNHKMYSIPFVKQ